MSDHVVYTLSITMAAALLAYMILWSGLQTFNANPTKRFKRIWLKLGLYYAAYTMPIWALLTVIGWSQKVTPLLSDLSLPVVLVAIIIMGLYFYSVIVQPNRLRLSHQSIDLNLQAPLTVAVLADLRIGIYSGKPRHIRKLIATINALPVDAVLITGDWLYYPGADLVGQLMLFKGANKPIYTVMSTSDLRYQSLNTTKQGQPLLEDSLSSAFDVLDITYIGQYCTPLAAIQSDRATAQPMNAHSINAQSATAYSANSHHNHDGQAAVQKERVDIASSVAMLCGWQDIHKKLINTESITKIETSNKTILSAEITKATKPVIILASRLDSITDLPNSLAPRPLLITGAAKAVGQQLLTAQQRQAEHITDDQSAIFDDYTSVSKSRGLYQHSSAQIFVSSGIGTRGLPFRLSRPTIDVLTIR